MTEFSGSILSLRTKALSTFLLCHPWYDGLSSACSSCHFKMMEEKIYFFSALTFVFLISQENFFL